MVDLDELKPECHASAEATGRIICAIARAPEATGVAALGSALGHRLRSAVTLAHVIEPIAAGAAVNNDRIRRLFLSRGRELLDEVATAAACGDWVLGVVRIGQPASELLDLVAAGPADLLVCGGSSRDPIRELARGSVSRRLASEARCPTLVVPQAAIPLTRSRGRAERLLTEPEIICGVDGSAVSIAAGLVAMQLVRELGGKLTLVVAGVSGGSPAVDGAVELIGSRGVPAEIEIEPGQPAEAIESVARRKRAALIVVGSRGRGPVTSAILGSTSAGLRSRASRPLLVVPHSCIGARRGPTRVAPLLGRALIAGTAHSAPPRTTGRPAARPRTQGVEL